MQKTTKTGKMNNLYQS